MCVPWDTLDEEEKEEGRRMRNRSIIHKNQSENIYHRMFPQTHKLLLSGVETLLANRLAVQEKGNQLNGIV